MRSASRRQRAGKPAAEDFPFRQVAQHLPTPCWISDSEGVIVWVNEAWLQYTGATVAKIGAEGLKGLHDPAVYGDVVRRWQDVKAAGLAAEMEFPLLGRDGRFRPFHTRVVPIRDQAGRITRWFGTNTDMSARAEAEARLRSSQEQLREVFERAGDGIFITDAAGRLSDVNPAACAMTQFSRDELLGKSVWDMIDRAEEASLVEARRQEESLRDWRIRRKDGSFLDVEISSRRLGDGRRLGVARDISARKAAHESERRAMARLVKAQTERAGQAERQLHHFWEASRDLFVIASNTDGFPLLINDRAWTATLGHSADQVMATRLIDFVHPDDREPTVAMSRRQFEEGAYFGFENRYRHADGSWIWLSWNVVRVGGHSYCIARDITRERLVQDRLAQSERQFRLLVGGVVDYALFMLDPAGTVTNWNPGAQRIKGYAADEIVGRHFSVFYTEADRAAGAPAVNLRRAAELGRHEAEGWRVRKDGGLFWANVVIDAIRDETGELIGFAKITRDITERREAQRQLEAAREALFQTQKMEAIGQLTGGIAHDFNNVLMAVLGSLELVRKRLPYQASVTPLLDNAISGAERGATVTQRLLAFARRQELNLEVVDLASLVQGMLGFLQSSIGPATRIHLSLPSGLPCVRTDPNQLETALLNLALNARDAMPEGGRITVSARRETIGAGDPTLPAGDYVAVALADTGEGMDAETLARATEPFFTTKGIGKGTGLGLPMVHGLAAQSGGRLIIRSRKGRGTTVEVWLPAAGAMAAAEGGVERVAPPAAMVRRVVLAVDDDPLVLLNTVAMLEDLGHEVVQAASGEEALQALAGCPEIDLVITDQAMPRMSGVQLCEAIRRARPEMPLLIATGYAEMPPGVAADLRRVAKPFTQAELASAVREAFHPTRSVDRIEAEA